MRLAGKPIGAGKRYRVAGWAPVAADAAGIPVWEVLGDYLRQQKVVGRRRLNLPRVDGEFGNPGLG